jgi:DNA polymerase-3 subunit delta'
MPHAWLLGGPPGIGKATLAYRAARFVLANADPQTPAVQAAESLAVDPEHRVFRRVAAQAHSDLLVLRRTVGDNGKLRTVISVDEVRRTVSFFGSTAGEGGWRVCIVDAADELNDSAANALLKVIEEPPARSLFLLVSHSPGRLLPTIRSRCRRLQMRPLTRDEVTRIAAARNGRSADDKEIATAVAFAEGSPGGALALLESDTLALRTQIEALLNKLPTLDPAGLHALGDDMAGAERAPLAAFADAVRNWLTARVSQSAEPRRLAHLAEVWDKVNRAARDVELFNLERKPLVFSVFGLLAEAAR